MSLLLNSKRASQSLGRVFSYNIDLEGCHADLIHSECHIQEFVDTLLAKLNEKAHGACVIVHHGTSEQDRGYTMFQLTESFSLSAHFIEADLKACIHFFSDRELDEQLLKHFCQNFFEAQSVKTHKLIR